MISISRGIAVYNSLPLWMQGWMGAVIAPLPASIRGHRKVHALATKISESSNLMALESLQTERLRAIIQHASVHSPWFIERIKEAGVDVNEIKSIEDISALPILTKQDVRHHADELVSKQAKMFRPGRVRTSGSTGEPLEFLLDQNTRITEYASEWRCLMGHGARLGGKTATFRGNHYKKHKNAGPHWFRHALSGDLNFNTYSMTPEACDRYARRLKRFRPSIYRAFPSSLAHLAKNISDKMLSPDAVAFCSSEMMDEDMREAIRQHICPTVINWYSQSEYVASAGECPEGRMHINTEFGLVEVVDQEGKSVPDGTIGRLIGTSLTNFSQPFIRYDLDDLGSISTDSCPCGRPHPVLSTMEGRTADLLHFPDGRTLTSSHMIHWWKHLVVKKWNLDDFSWVQIVQTGPAKVTVRVVPNEGSSPQKHQASLKEALSELWGVEVTTTIEEYAEIPHGQKWRFSTYEGDVHQAAE